MRRYLRLYKHFVKFSLMQAMQFRFDFFFRIIMDCIFYLVNVLFYQVLFQHSGALGGWTESQVMIFISGFLLVDAIQMTIISNGTWMIPVLVNKGELDYYLLRPISSLFFLTTRDFAFNSFINVLVAAGIMVWSFSLSPEAFPIYKILLFLFLTLNGTYLFFLCRILTLTPVFWTHNGRGLEMIFWTLDKFAERPDGIYRGWVRKILVSIMPFAIISSFPARSLFQGNPWEIASYCVGIVVIMNIITVAVWNLGLKHYSSASS
jgi:ABC-2 type transport system permease protein